MVSIAELERVSPDLLTQAILFDQTPVLETQVAAAQDAALDQEQRRIAVEVLRQENLDWARRCGFLGTVAMN